MGRLISTETLRGVPHGFDSSNNGIHGWSVIGMVWTVKDGYWTAVQLFALE